MIGQEEWDNADIPGVIEEAILEVISVKGRGVAQATKLLHLKRRALVPVIDDFVARALGRRLSQDAAPRSGRGRHESSSSIFGMLVWNTRQRLRPLTGTCEASESNAPSSGSSTA